MRKVKALPTTSKADEFRVSWSGADDAGGSGIRDYVVDVSENGGSIKRRNLLRGYGALITAARTQKYPPPTHTHPPWHILSFLHGGYR